MKPGDLITLQEPAIRFLQMARPNLDTSHALEVIKGVEYDGSEPVITVKGYTRDGLEDVFKFNADGVIGKNTAEVILQKD
ncbi:hypothetical protein A2272_03995 [Candidatus Peregrinibacteria bacterium RIFOXYA12_FULL_33_12]|nr:MAG: hypothetical protein A2263_03755 [Candidatus Peregrinibacteria bacterium RIFOXYA2_FULL_33_21]OGJ46596.1 MAG: hypothetical protein A2272_03995 [Candidatus Peregrinibacteria bacterium RIFOXYA12_FULL_33_12]OGJ51474.1 MAG: hypothetical protein A2307_00190 [Candidatus Peregrinibacteria bacterium RIFOXYB2_FULL_33_20]